MRQKTDSIANGMEQDKFELQGWNNDIQDLQASNNLLKILQKKITFPVLQNQHKSKKNISKKVQTLPAVYENPRKPGDQQKIGKFDQFQLTPKMHIQKRTRKQNRTKFKQPQMISHQNMLGIKKSKTQKKNLSILYKMHDGQQAQKPMHLQNNQQYFNRHHTQKNIQIQQIQKQLYPQISKTKSKSKMKEMDGGKQKEVVNKQGTKYTSEFNNTYLNFFESVKNAERQNNKKSPDFNKTKHQKIASLQALPIKQKLATFDQYAIKQCKINQKEKEKQKQKNKQSSKKDGDSSKRHMQTTNEQLQINKKSQIQNGKKQIKWQKFSVSQQKFVYKGNKLKQIESTTNYFVAEDIQSRANRQRTIKHSKSKLKQQQNYSKMFWIQKILQKSKFNAAEHHSSHSSNTQANIMIEHPLPVNSINHRMHATKIVKTESNDFVDGHLQSYQGTSYFGKL